MLAFKSATSGGTNSKDESVRGVFLGRFFGGRGGGSVSEAVAGAAKKGKEKEKADDQ